MDRSSLTECRQPELQFHHCGLLPGARWRLWLPEAAAGKTKTLIPSLCHYAALCLVTAGVLCNAEVVTSLAAAAVVRSCGSPDLS